MRKILSLILAFCCIIPTEALQLSGGCSNTRGRIGVTVSTGGRIYAVHKISPAFNAGLKPGDIVVEADGKQGASAVDAGTAGSTVRLIIMRGKDILTFNIVRTDPRLIKD